MNANQLWLSKHELGRIDGRPIWEMVYNHYVVRKGMDAPYVTAMAKLQRPEHGSKDHFGFGSLACTLDAEASPYPPSPIAPVPTGLKAVAGVSRVYLEWDKSPGDTAQGYAIYRAMNAGGPFEEIAEWDDDTLPAYIDHSKRCGGFL